MDNLLSKKKIENVDTAGNASMYMYMFNTISYMFTCCSFCMAGGGVHSDDHPVWPEHADRLLQFLYVGGVRHHHGRPPRAAVHGTQTAPAIQGKGSY